MSEIQPYTFPVTGDQMRALLREGEAWLIAADVTSFLGFTRSRDALRMVDPEDKGAHFVRTPGGLQEVSIINESGLYTLVLRSNRKEAKAFRRWVTAEVLPTLRRTGRYEVAPALPQSYAEALRELASTVERAEEAEHRYAIAAPKAEAYSAFMDADGTYSFEQVAKMLLAETGLGRNNLFKRLRAEGVLTDKNLPYQRYAHHFHVVASSFEHSDGRREVTYTTRVRATGIEFLRRKLGVAVSDIVTTEEINA